LLENWGARKRSFPALGVQNHEKAECLLSPLSPELENDEDRKGRKSGK
jgi:hypothetical protein